jgi:hypothetical protein
MSYENAPEYIEFLKNHPHVKTALGQVAIVKMGQQPPVGRVLTYA